MSETRGVRHWGGFILSGGVAWLIDTGITGMLIHALDVGPILARVAGIAVAMVAAWLMHRRITFAVKAPPSLAEFGRFAAVAWSANALNFVIYAAILWVSPSFWWLAAIVISTGIAAIFSYFGFRLGVFREPPTPV